MPPPTVTLTADDVVSQIGGVTQASGKVEVKRLDMDLFADLLTYDRLSDTAHAQGNVRINRGLDWFSADRVDLELTRNAGTLIGTEYELGARKAGGHAQRIELIDRNRSTAYDANYTSCTRDGPDEPDWIITGDQIDIDTTTNEGKATHAVLRFLGVPILAAPSLTFPVTAERKSGWLPPTGDLSNRSGFAVSVPYYWNIEPNLDATLSPGYSTKRGVELTGELRYLEPNDLGQLTTYVLPNDEVYGDPRGAVEWAHEGSRSDWLTYSARVQRVSDAVVLEGLPQPDAGADAAPAADRPVGHAPLPAVRRRRRDRHLRPRAALPDAAGSRRARPVGADQRALPAQPADRPARQRHAEGPAAPGLRGRRPTASTCPTARRRTTTSPTRQLRAIACASSRRPGAPYLRPSANGRSTSASAARGPT